MKKHAVVQGKVSLNTGGYMQYSLPLILFKEDGVDICYCPALDLSGYGSSEQEAKDSYQYALEAYFDYTIKKRTLETDLRRLGWAVKHRSKKMVPPDMTEILSKNDNFKRIWNTFPFKKVNKETRIPILAV